MGDLITVKISAESTAVQEAGTTTRKSSDIGANFFDTFDQYSLDTGNNSSLRKMQDYRIGGNDNYSGVGQTTRKSKVEATVSCIITTILPNGNLVISGERTVDVNNDSEIIQISGIVRPADIDIKNSVESFQIAQFNISLKGKGVVNSKQTPGFLSNFFNWVFLNEVKAIICIFIIIYFWGDILFSEETSVKIKDIYSRVIESRDNQLFGYGLVVGLRNTGDTQRSVFTEKALTNLLKKMGIKPDSKDFKSRNVASVMVTMNLPPYARPGQKLDVSVSSLGDATSLSGGTLLMTPLQGADFQTYAVAQGQVIVGGVSGKSSKVNFRKNQTTAGRVPNGAIVEKEVKVTREDQLNVTLVLNKPDFSMSSKVVKALKNNGFKKVSAIDAGSISIPIAEIAEMPYVDIVQKIENTKITPESTSKVVINSKSGIVVIGENVRLLPVAITHGDFNSSIRRR